MKKRLQAILVVVVTFFIFTSSQAQDKSAIDTSDICNLSLRLSKGETNFLIQTYANLSDANQMVGMLWIYEKLAKTMTSQGWKNYTLDELMMHSAKISVQYIVYDFSSINGYSFFPVIFDVQIAFFIGESTIATILDIKEELPSEKNKTPPTVTDETIRAISTIMNTTHDLDQISKKSKKTASSE